MQKTIILGGVGTRSNYSEALIKSSLQHGYTVLAIARSPNGKEDLLKVFENEQQVSFTWLDLRDEAALNAAIDAAEQSLGPIAAYIHNSAIPILKPFLETDITDYRASWETTVETAITASLSIIPRFQKHNKGTLIFAGATASIKGNSGSAPFATSKFALRALSQSLAREFGPQGIHVAHMIIDGIIEGERAQDQFGLPTDTCINSVDLAETTLSLIEQPPSCWTQELDLRPFREKF